MKEKLFFRWKSLLFDSHTAPKSCLYPGVLQAVVGSFSVSDQDILGFKNSRKVWNTSNSEVLERRAGKLTKGLYHKSD